MASRGNYAQMHMDIAQRVLELQSRMSHGVADGFDSGQMRVNWSRMIELAHMSQSDPVLRAQLNAALRPAFEALAKELSGGPQR